MSLVRKGTAEERRSESHAPAAGKDGPAEPAEKRQKLQDPCLPGGSGYKMQNKPHLVWQTGQEAGGRGPQDVQQVLQRKYTCWRDTTKPYLHPDGNINLQLACWAKPNITKRYNEEKDLFMEVVRRGAGSVEREQQVLAVMAGMKVRGAVLLCAGRSLSEAPLRSHDHGNSSVILVTDPSVSYCTGCLTACGLCDTSCDTTRV